jgi:alpha-1,2-mannosyltransferase
VLYVLRRETSWPEPRRGLTLAIGSRSAAKQIHGFLVARGRMVRAALVIAVAEIAVWCQAVLVLQLPRAADLSDFRAYDVAARIGTRQGWSHIYDTALQLRVLHEYWPGASRLDYISPPFNAWLVTPLTLLSPHAAFAVFAAIGWAALLVSSQLASPPDRWYRVVFAFLALGLLAGAATVTFGQVSGLVMLSVIASWRLIDARHESWAGVALAGIALKPQLALLVPVALVLAGRWRTVATFAATCAVLAAAAVVVVGLPGLEQLLRLDTSYTRDPSTQVWALSTLIGGGPAIGLAVQAVVAVVALVPAWQARHKPVGLALAAAVAGSLLASVYLHGMDLAVYLFPIWVAARQPWLALRVLAGLLWLSLDFDVTRPWITALVAAVLLAAFAGLPALTAKLGTAEILDSGTLANA